MLTNKRHIVNTLQGCLSTLTLGTPIKWHCLSPHHLLAIFYVPYTFTEVTVGPAARRIWSLLFAVNEILLWRDSSENVPVIESEETNGDKMQMSRWLCTTVPLSHGRIMRWWPPWELMCKSAPVLPPPHFSGQVTTQVRLYILFAVRAPILHGVTWSSHYPTEHLRGFHACTDPLKVSQWLLSLTTSKWISWAFSSVLSKEPFWFFTPQCEILISLQTEVVDYGFTSLSGLWARLLSVESLKGSMNSQKPKQQTTALSHYFHHSTMVINFQLDLERFLYF